MGTDKFIPALQEILDSYRNADPPTEKKLPVEADVPELLFDMGYGSNGTVLGNLVGISAGIPPDSAGFRKKIGFF